MHEEARVLGCRCVFENELIGVPATEWACLPMNRFGVWPCLVALFSHHVSSLRSLCRTVNGVRIRRGGASRKYHGGTMTRAKGGPFDLRADLEMVDKVLLYLAGLFHLCSWNRHE